MILFNGRKNKLNVKSKKTFRRLFWGFSALTCAFVPLAFSSGCYYQGSNQIFYVDAPEAISQDLGITSIDEIPTKVAEFNQKSTDEQINYLFGNESKLVSSYIDKFKAKVDGHRRINFTLSLAPNFVFTGSQASTKVFMWTFGILPTNVKVHPRGLWRTNAQTTPGSPAYQQKTTQKLAEQVAEYCQKFNAVNSLAQQIALIFGNNSEFNPTNTKAIVASFVPDNDQTFLLNFKVKLNSGFAFASENLPQSTNQPLQTSEDTLTHTFSWSPSDFLLIQPGDYNHFLVMKDLQPVAFANWFNRFGETFQSEYLLNNHDLKLVDAKAIADGKRCQIFFHVTKNEKSGLNFSKANTKSEELSSWVISEKEYNNLTNLISFYNQKEFDLSSTNPFKNTSLQTLDFSQLVRVLALKFPPELTFAFSIKSFAFERERSESSQQVDLCCRIGLCQHRFISVKPNSLASDEFKIRLRHFVSIDTTNALEIINQYAYSATDAAALSDQLAQALICPPKNDDFNAITLKGILDQVHQPLSQVLSRDSHIITQISQLLSKSGKLGGFSLTQLEPIIQKALMGLFQNKSINDIINLIINQSPDNLVSTSAPQELANSLMIDPTVVNQIFSVFSSKIPVISSAVETPLRLLTSPSTFGSERSIKQAIHPWWTYGLAAKDALLVFLAQSFAMKSLDLLSGIMAVYLAEEISQINQLILDPIELEKDPKLRQVSEALDDLNQCLYLTDSTLPRTPVYISKTKKDTKDFSSDITDPHTQKNCVGFNLAQCAYRNLTSPEMFIRNFNEACLKRIHTAKRDEKDPDKIIVPARARYQLQAFGFVINQSITDDQKVTFKFDPSDHANPTLEMTLNGNTTCLSLCNLSAPLSINYWVNSDKYKDGLFNVSFYGLFGNCKDCKGLKPNKTCLLKDVCKILNYNFAGPGGLPIINDDLYKKICGEDTSSSISNKHQPGWIDQSGLCPKNLYDFLQGIFKPIEETKVPNQQYAFAKGLVPKTYQLTYDCATYSYVFKETYSTPQPKEITLNLASLKSLLGDITYHVSFFPIKIAEYLKDDFKLPNNVNFKNTITFNNLDFLNSSSRLIMTQQMLDFNDMSETIDPVFGQNVSGKNPRHQISYVVDGIIGGLISGFLSSKLKDYFVISVTDPSGQHKDVYKKLDQSLTIQFIN